MSVEIEGDDQKSVFTQLAIFQEVFDVSACGACGKENLRFAVRSVDSNNFYEVRCADCGAKLTYGQHKQGGSLFPKEWVRWNGTEEVVVGKK
jgi:DNA-directed RNA polymerase subunit RPC12/RpoP